MNVACGNCAATELPLGDDGLCLTCRTIEVVRVASHDSALNPNGATSENGAHARHTSVPEVAGAELLDDVAAFIERFQVLPSREVADLLALWVLHTHSFEAAWATPYLRITSAAPESGKTQLLEILATLVRRGWHAVNPSVAVLYRKIDRHRPSTRWTTTPSRNGATRCQF